MKLVRLIVLVAILGLLLCVWKAGHWLHKEAVKKARYESMIENVAKRYDIDPLLIRAQIWRESNFDASAWGTAQERGLMQVTPGAAQDWLERQRNYDFTLDDLYKPDLNILVGTWYLARAVRRWENSDNPIVFALAEYNAGITHARRWAEGLEEPLSSEEFLNRIDFPSTKEYITSILKRYEYYRENPEISPLNEIKDLYYVIRHRVERQWIKKK